MKIKTLSILLIIASFLIFGIYVWWAYNMNHANGGWGAGIWLVSVGVFLTGVFINPDA